MGEPSCLSMDYSHQTEIIRRCGCQQENHISALGGSISFGRFLSESLDWGKWSSFSHNRYLEEVEKYSVPGSVAQKKAHFEAHYKKVAAKRATALIEQANATSKSSPESQTDDGFNNDAQVEYEKLSNHMVDREVEAADKHDCSSRTAISLDSCNDNNEPEIVEVEKSDAIKEDQIRIDPSLQLEATDKLEDIEHQNKSEFELGKTCTLEKKPLKESFVINRDNEDSAEKKTRVPTSRSSVIHRSSGLPPSPASKIPFSPTRLASSLRYSKENISTPSSNLKYRCGSKENKKSIPKSLPMSVNLTQFQNGVTSTKTKSSPAHAKVKETKATMISLKPSPHCLCHFETPTKVSLNGIPSLSSVAGQSEKKSYSSYTSIRACRQPTATATFSPSTRADERKEMKKEKSAETESRKLCDSLCFKAITPEFYGNAELTKNERTEKSAEREQSKLQQNNCFKARPLPGFYHNIEQKMFRVKKIPAAQPHSQDFKDKQTKSLPFQINGTCIS